MGWRGAAGGVKNSLGSIIDSIFFSGCTKLCKIVAEVKKHFLVGSGYIDQIFTGDLSGVDSAGLLRQGVIMD